MVEVLNAVVYMIIYAKFGFGPDFIFYSLILSLLLTISFIDMREMIIPNSLTAGVLILSVIHKFINYFLYNLPFGLFDGIIGLLAASGLFLIIVIASHGGMGGGDVTLTGVLGFVLGVRYILLNIFLSFVLAAIISVVLLAAKIKTMKDPIPFGPFIVLGFFTTVLWGQEIINLYVNFM